MRFSRLFVPILGATGIFASSLSSPALAGEPPNNDWLTIIERTAPQPATENTPKTTLKIRLGFADERAALQALQFALDEVGDGSTFVWHRKAGNVSGTIRPTTAFVDDKNRLCRHLVFSLSAGDYTSTIEGIACRTKDGYWQL